MHGVLIVIMGPLSERVVLEAISGPVSGRVFFLW